MKRPLLIALSAGLISAVPAAGQQTFSTWEGPQNGLWSLFGNWSHGTPNNVGGTHWVPMIPGGKSVVHNTSNTIDKLGMAPGAHVTINNGTTLTILGDTSGQGVTGLISSEGVIHLNSTLSITDIAIVGPPGASTVFGNIFQNPALIAMTNHINNRIRGVNGVETFTTDFSAVVEGSGQIGVNTLRIQNHGTIRATGSAGLVIDPNASGLDNWGGALIAEGGTLNLQSGVFSQNAEGKVRAFNGSNVLLEAATLRGGSFASTGGSRLDAISGSVIEDFISWNLVRVPNGNTLYLRGLLTLAQDGSVMLDSTLNLTDLVVGAGVVTVDGQVGSGSGGDIVMSNNVNNRIRSDTVTHRLVLDTHAKIRGSGQVGVNTMALTIGPNAKVYAQGSAGLFVDPNAAGVDNNGVMRAFAGSELTLQNGLFDNAGGSIEVEQGGLCTMSGAMVAGGLLSGPASSGFSLQSGSELASVTNSGWVQVPNNHTAYVSGVLNNAPGELRIASSLSITDLVIRGPVSLTGTGMISTSNNANNRVRAEDGVARLTNTAGHTIRGAGQIGVNAMALTNDGLIEASGSADLVIDPNAAGVENNGTLRAAAASTLTLANGAFDNADGQIEVAPTGSCVISAAKISAGDLVGPPTGGFSLQSGSELAGISNAGSVALPNGHTGFLSGTLDNAGTVNLVSTLNLTNLVIRGPVSVLGTGTVALSNNINNRIYAENSLDRLTNASTIRGSGQIGVNAMAVTNNGLIEAVGSAGLLMDPNSAGVENNAMIRAANGSEITLANGVFDNVGGVLDVAAGGAGTIQAAKVIGGTMGSAAGSAFSLTAGSELAGVTNTGTITIPNNNTGFISGTHQNLQGTLNLSSTLNLTNLVILGHSALSGDGAVVMSNNANNRIYAQNNSDRLTNDTGHTIRGAGQIGANAIAFTNKGTVLSEGSAGLVIDPNADGFDNQGLLRAQTGTITINAGPFTTSGSVVADAGRLINRAAGDWVQTAGSVTANGEVQVVSDVYQLQGGTLGGSGIVDSNVTNSGGVVAPGNSPGVLTIQGTYTQQAGGALSVELGGVTPGPGHDQLAVTGAVSLAGTLNIGTVGGFAPGWGDVFTILTGSAVTGTFGTVNAPALPAGTVKVIYGSTTVKVAACMADCNADGLLAVSDFGCFQTMFVQGDPYADCNADTVLTVADFGCFQTMFVAGCP